MLGEVLTAIVTPFRSDGSVDLETFRSLAMFLVENGSDGLVVAGTTGEAPTLEDDERLALFEAAVQTVGDRASVVAGTGTYSTAHSVYLTHEASQIGVDAFLVVTPYYNKPPPEGIIKHFATIAGVSDKPVIVYNIPQRVVINIDPDTITRLAEIPNVRAVKQATTDIEQAKHIVESGLDLYAGNDDLIVPFLDVGGIGGVCVYTHIVGPQVKKMVRRHREGDADGAREIEDALRPVVDALAVTTNPIPVKAALAMFGRDVGSLRLPLVAATKVEREQIRVELERADVLVAA